VTSWAGALIAAFGKVDALGERMIGHVSSAPMRSGIVSCCLAIVICVVAAAVARTPLLNDLENWGFDMLVNRSRPARGDARIVIVDFDDTTLAQLHTFPVPRRTLAEVIRRVSAGAPKVIGLDILLSEPRSADEDALLVGTLADAGNVIVPSEFGSDQLPVADPLPQFCVPDPQAVPYCKPGGALGVAFINLPVDDDGFMRRTWLMVRGARPQLSFSLALASDFLGKPMRRERAGVYELGGKKIYLDDTGLQTFLIGRWPANGFQTISVSRILAIGFDPAMVKDKLVLVGQSSAAGADRHCTPVFRLRRQDGSRELISGTQFHATAIAALLEGATVRIAGDGPRWAVAFVLAWIAAWLVIVLRPGYATPVTLAGIVTSYVVAQASFSAAQLWLKYIAIAVAVLLAMPAALGYRFVRERFLKSEAEGERRELMGIFSRYVSPEVADEIWRRRGEIVLAGQERIATVLFSDIRSFTKITAGRSSAEVLQWLNDYFTAMAVIVQDEGGFLNKFIGDGLMAVFGVPVNHGEKEDACRAVRAALRMLQKVEHQNQLYAGDPKRPRLKIGVGIHTGMLTAGNVGSSDRLEYSVIGETVNLASRLESLTKEFTSDLVLSPQTYELVHDCFLTRELGETTVRGFEDTMQNIKVYGVACAQAAARPL
jgi:adenylate cyclase